MNTKYLAVLLFVASVNAAELLDPFHRVRDKCRHQFGFTIEKLRNSRDHLEQITPYIVCFIKELNALTPDGFIDEHVTVNSLSALVPITISVPIIRICNHQARISRSISLSDRVLVFSKCMAANIHPVIYNLAGFLGPPVYSW